MVTALTKFDYTMVLIFHRSSSPCYCLRGLDIHQILQNVSCAHILILLLLVANPCFRRFLKVFEENLSASTRSPSIVLLPQSMHRNCLKHTS